MDYLDYVQMTKGQKFAYKLKSFFAAIPKVIVKFFMYIGYFFKKLFAIIGTGLKGYGYRFAKGDIGTKLSFIIMGAGNMMHRQIGKGLIFLATEVAYIWFMISFGSVQISKIFSMNVDVFRDGSTIVSGALGSEPPLKQENLLGVEEIVNLDTLDNSNKILLFFVMTVLISIAFFAIYIANTKSAFATQQQLKEGVKPASFLAEMKDFLDEKFHVTLLTLPVLLLMLFTVLPIIFTIFMAFTNYDKEHQPPGSL